MKISLIIQCIDTFGFVPAEDDLRFFADGILLNTIRKDGGFYVVTHSIPKEFALSVKSKIYYGCELKVITDGETVRLDLIRKNPPPGKPAVWLNAEKGGKAALEYGYFYLGSSVKSGDTLVSAENPFRFCIEGRSFLLCDTQSGNEEFIVLEESENSLLTDHKTKKIKYDYNAESSVMLPAFDLYVSARIPAEKPVGKASVRIYGENCEQYVRVTADE